MFGQSEFILQRKIDAQVFADRAQGSVETDIGVLLSCFFLPMVPSGLAPFKFEVLSGRHRAFAGGQLSVICVAVL